MCGWDAVQAHQAWKCTGGAPEEARSCSGGCKGELTEASWVVAVLQGGPHDVRPGGVPAQPAGPGSL